MSNLLKFNNETKLRQTVYAFIASQLLTKTEREMYRHVFESIDVDHSGTLTEDEFIRGTKKFFGEQLTEIDAMQLYKKIDLNGDGTIQFNEFVLVALHRDELHSQQKLRAAFDMMDKNGDQTISPDELLDVFSFNENFDIEMAREMIRQVDSNADGGIQYDEFNMMMKNIDFEKILGGGSQSSGNGNKQNS